MIEAITAGLVAIANGAEQLLGGIVSPIAAMVALILVSAAFLAAVEFDILNRQGTKPRIGRH